MSNEASFVKPGLVRKFTAAAVRVNGEVLEIAGLPGHMLDDKAIGDIDAEQHIRCVDDVRKITGAVTVGQTVYWDEDATAVDGSTGAATIVAANGDFVLGVCVVAADSGDNTVRVSLAWESDQLVKTFGAAGGGVSQGILGGAGISGDLATGATAGNFLEFRLDGSAAAGTYRGMYMRLHLTGGAGGEALRGYTHVEDNTPDDTCNGAHLSLAFGSSAGNITGLGTAARNTLEVPNRSLGGTTGAVMAEIWAAGASSANGGLMSLLRCVIDGESTGKAALEDNVNLIEISTGTNGSGNLVSAVGNEPTWSSATHKIRIVANGVTMYLVAVLA